MSTANPAPQQTHTHVASDRKVLRLRQALFDEVGDEVDGVAQDEEGAAAEQQGLTLDHVSAYLEPRLTPKSTLHTLKTP